ncbi:hypothetical protein JHK86_039633 [Glycine max]|nr:hypothetical protein JHK86_039633 [Glycine max]
MRNTLITIEEVLLILLQFTIEEPLLSLKMVKYVMVPLFELVLNKMSDEISLILHHNGKFIQNANGALEYVGGEFCVWKEVETNLVNVWTAQELCKACRIYVKFVSIYYLVSGIGLQRLENDRDVLSICQIGLAVPEKKVLVYLENDDPKGGPVNDIGPVIKVHGMPINCSAENVIEVVVEECTQNGIKDMDVDGAKGGSDDEMKYLELVYKMQKLKLLKQELKQNMKLLELKLK